MKKSLFVLALAAALAPALAQAEAGDWVVRFRVVDVAPNESSDLGKTVNNLLPGAMSPGAELAVGSKVIPKLDISYYFTKNIAAELILAVGSRHDVSVTGDTLAAVGNQPLGSVNLLPPSLTAQWHFNPDQTIDPYLGAGVNYSLGFHHSLQFTGGALKRNDIRIDRNLVAFAAQEGVDINLKDGWLINADVKYITLNTDVEARLGAGNNGAWTKIDSLDINPWVFGIGIGKKF